MEIGAASTGLPDEGQRAALFREALHEGLGLDHDGDVRAVVRELALGGRAPLVEVLLGAGRHGRPQLVEDLQTRFQRGSKMRGPPNEVALKDVVRTTAVTTVQVIPAVMTALVTPAVMMATTVPMMVTTVLMMVKTVLMTVTTAQMMVTTALTIAGRVAAQAVPAAVVVVAQRPRRPLRQRRPRLQLLLQLLRLVPD